jgi:hypothetical protein
MKTSKIIISSVLLFSMQVLMAQFGQGGYSGNQMGNRMGNQSMPETVKERPIEETVTKIVERLKIQLSLDELQVIAISNLITENMKKQNAILKKEGSNDDKTSELKAASEKTDLDILILLNKDQKAKYKLLSEDAKKQQEANRRGR